MCHPSAERGTCNGAMLLACRFDGFQRGIMIRIMVRITVRIQSICPIIVLIVCAVLVGCRANSIYGGGGGPQGGNSSVVLAMTDSPPSGVTILAAEVTLTGATLSPGNISLFSGSTTVELTRLQTDVAYIATAANIPAGNYTSITLTFANPSLTIEYDTSVKIGTCAALGTICTMAPTSTANLSTTIPLTGFSIASSSVTGLLVDVNLENLLSATLGADFGAGTTATSFTPGGLNAPPVGAEDVVGQVSNINAGNNTFTLTNALASYSLRTDNTSNFAQFPVSSTCSSPAFSCVQNNQILSVDIGMQADGTILARNLLFEDADSSDAEVEGIITSSNVASSQFSMVVLTISAGGTGLSIGEPVTVQYSLQTRYSIDYMHVDNLQVDTSSFTSSFTGPADLVTGQQVSIRRNNTSGSTIIADRVRLRSTRITATVQSVGAPTIILTNLPFLFSGHGGVTQIFAQTSVTPPTIYYEINGSINASTNILGDLVSVRGPLFNTGGANRTMVTDKVVLKP